MSNTTIKEGSIVKCSTPSRKDNLYRVINELPLEKRWLVVDLGHEKKADFSRRVPCCAIPQQFTTLAD
jgi:hypothetical protein